MTSCYHSGQSSVLSGSLHVIWDTAHVSSLVSVSPPPHAILFGESRVKGVSYILGSTALCFKHQFYKPPWFLMFMCFLYYCWCMTSLRSDHLHLGLCQSNREFGHHGFNQEALQQCSLMISRQPCYNLLGSTDPWQTMDFKTLKPNLQRQPFRARTQIVGV